MSVRSLVKRSFTECGVSECDREVSTMKTHGLIRSSHAMKKKIFSVNSHAIER